MRPGSREALVLAAVLAATSFGFPAAADEPCEGYAVVPSVGPTCPADGLLEVLGPDGGSLGFTHGVDPLRARIEIPLTPRAPTCITDTVANPYYMRVVYARASDDTDQYATRAPQIRTLVEEANGHLNSETAPFSKTADYKVLCSGTTIVVENEVLPTSKSSATFANVVSDLTANGAKYTDGKQKYWVFYDENTCSCGVGHVYNDSSAAVSNLNNGNGVALYAVTFGVLDWSLWMHENGHNLGAVQSAAPISTWYFHCNDGLDIMCYSDGASNSAYVTTACPGTVERWDCNNDNYYNPSPPGGSWLSSHWNIGSTVNRYITSLPSGGTNTAPSMVSLSCSPNPAPSSQTVTCTFQANDDSTGVFYTVSWGDGSPTTRVPSSGTVAPGSARTATHAWATTGAKTVTVTATDNGAPPLTSAQRTTTETITNVAPAMVELSCTPNPSVTAQSVACTFRASDDSTGVFYTVNWGDATGTTRVPSSGTVAPGSNQGASHIWSSTGTYTVSVTATDNAAPPLTSAARTASQIVNPSVCLDVTGTATAGAGPQVAAQAVVEVEDVTADTVSIPPNCRGRPFVLVTVSSAVPPGTTPVPAANFEVCWYAGPTWSGCTLSLGETLSGTVPATATSAHIVLVYGAQATYRFRVT